MNRNRTSQTAMMRARLIISGRVQGVYFRASAQDVARARRLAGWIRNRSDGAVEVVVEGEAEAVEGFIAWCHQGPPGAHVTTVQVTTGPYSGEFRGFRIVG
jgi:acylphosphatase